MATYKVKSKIIGPDSTKTLSKTRKVDANSWPEAKRKVKPEVEKDRAKVARNFADTDPKPRVSYQGSTVDMVAKNRKTGIVKKVTTQTVKGKPVSTKTYGSTTHTSRGSSGRVVGSNPARKIGGKGGWENRMPDIFKLKDV